MVKQVLVFTIPILLLFATCTTVVYDNPLDLEGTHGDDIKSSAGSLDDEDNDSIPNYVDDDWTLRPRDKTPPVITIFGGDTVTIEKDDPMGKLARYKDVTNKNLITAVDPEGSRVTIKVIENVNVFTVNEGKTPYKITYIATDTAENSSSKDRYVIITAQVENDTIPPILQIGDSIVYLSVNDPYEEQKYSAYDLGDGAPVDVKVTGDNVDVTKAGTYTKNYTATDSKGNSITLVKKIVVTAGPLNDLEPPVITLKGQDTIKLAQDQTIEDFKKTYVEAGCIAIDNIDGDITSEVKISEMKMQTPAIYYIEYTVSDKAGNSSEAVKRIIKTTVNVDETYPPTFVLVYPDSVIQVIKGTRWVEPGFAVTDAQDGPIPNSKVIVDSSNLVANLNVLGDYVVTYTATNSLGLSTTVERHVSVVLSSVDRFGPEITLKGRNPDTCLVQSKYVDPGCTAIDDRDGDVTSSVTVSGTVNINKIGKNTLTYSAVDKTGNRSSIVTRVVWVVADTLTTDLLVRYAVPTEDPLPSIKSTTWIVQDIDGEGPDLTNLKNISITWDLDRKSIDAFQFNYVGEPYNKAFNGVKQNFASASPSVTFTGTGLPGMDKTFYVTIMDGKFIWVEQKGSFAIIFKKTTAP